MLFRLALLVVCAWLSLGFGCQDAQAQFNAPYWETRQRPVAPAYPQQEMRAPVDQPPMHYHGGNNYQLLYPVPNSYPPRYRIAPDPYYYQPYPKYYGGFHHRHLSNYGVPPGDVGLRGNSLYWTPW